MAYSVSRAAVNPKLISSPSQQGLVQKDILAADDKTWKRGEFGYITSNTVAPYTGAQGANAPYCIFAEDQDTATSSTTVTVFLLQPEARFEIYVTNDGSDAAIASTDIDATKYELYTSSNVTYLDLNESTTGTFVIEDVASQYDPERNAATDTPGLCQIVYRP